MAFNQIFPSSYQAYQPGFQFQPYQQQYQQYQQNNPQLQNNGPVQQVQPQIQPQIQNGGFVSVRNIEEAYNWPVQPGNSITFKDENAPYIYTKTKGFSQLEVPIFERFRLVKEEEAQQTPTQATSSPVEPSEYERQINALWDEINALKAAVNASQAKEEKPAKKVAPKKEVNENE